MKGNVIQSAAVLRSLQHVNISTALAKVAGAWICLEQYQCSLGENADVARMGLFISAGSIYKK